jgi:hypothetical protein
MGVLLPSVAFSKFMADDFLLVKISRKRNCEIPPTDFHTAKSPVTKLFVRLDLQTAMITAKVLQIGRKTGWSDTAWSSSTDNGAAHFRQRVTNVFLWFTENFILVRCQSVEGPRSGAGDKRTFGLIESGSSPSYIHRL